MNSDSIFHIYAVTYYRTVTDALISGDARLDRLLQSREKVLTAGLYLAEHHFHMGFRLEVLMAAGDQLPCCPHCSEEIAWKYIGRYGGTIIDRENILLG